MLAFLSRVLWLLGTWIELTLFTVVLYSLSWLPASMTRRFYHRLFRLWCRVFVRALGVDLYLHEKHHNPIPKQFILIANHPSAVEDVGIPALFNAYPLAKEGVRKWWWVGRINVAAETVFVKRDDPDSRHAAVDTMLARLTRGDSIALFPEGGCKGRRIHSVFHSGAFDMSMKTGVPLLPVFIHYESQDRFEWREPYNLIQMMWRFMSSRNGRANYYLYDAIYPANETDKKAFAESVRQKYLDWQARYLD